MTQPDLQKTFDTALQHHQAGRPAQAEDLYRQVLAADPHHFNALHLLGLLAIQTARPDLAIDLVSRALALQPNFAPAHDTLGTAFRNARKRPEAIAAYRRALELKPDAPATWNNLGHTLREHGDPEAATAAFHKALALQPTARTCLNLTLILQERRLLDDAAAFAQRALELQPHYPEAHNALGSVLADLGRADDAIAQYRKALELKPDLPEAHNNLGIALAERARLPEAAAAFRQALTLKPNFAQAHVNLGNVCRTLGRLDDAANCYRHAFALHGQTPEALNNLGNVLADQSLTDEALQAFHQALSLRPNFPEAQNNLGNAFRTQARHDLAAAAYRHALALKPDYAPAASNLLYLLCFHPDFDSAALRREHDLWAQTFALPLQKTWQPHPNPRDPDRPLRIGYVSPDFRDHVIGLNILPLFLHRDRKNFTLFAYSNSAQPDDLTPRFAACADAFRDIVGLSDEAAAAQIRADAIDILIDLTLHLENNRLLLFARKPAPLQVTFAGYPGTTGLPAIDYRLTDPYLDPPPGAPDHHDHWYSEKSLRLPETFWSYQPALDLPVAPLPAWESGWLTFGCLNTFAKLNDPVLQLWGRILQDLPRSKLLLLAPRGSAREHVLDVLRPFAVTPDRLVFLDRQPRKTYLQTYNRINITLNTFPYNGHTTSLDALWMGVPTVSLVGPTVVGRAGLSQLTNLGLPELIARTPDQFMEIAVNLATDLKALDRRRASLRPRMAASPLMNPARFTQNIEAAYRQIWRRYCTL